MDDEKFDQALFMLDQDNHAQAFQRWRDRAARIRKDISNGLKDFKQRMSERFGAVGLWIATAAEDIWEHLVRFFRWLFGSRHRRFVIAAISVIVLILFFGFLKRRGVTRIGTASGPAKIAVSSFLGAAIVISLIAIAYHKLVPVFLNVDLWHYGVLLLLGAAFYFWRVTRLRNALLLATLLIVPIFSYGGRTAAKNKFCDVLASIKGERHAQEVKDLQTQVSARDQELAALRNERESEAHKVALQPSVNTNAPDDHAGNGELNSVPSIPAPPYVNQVCDNAWGRIPITTTDNNLIIEMSPGCFGQDIQLPWNSWSSQPVPAGRCDPSWRITFQFIDASGGVSKTMGPYSCMDKPVFNGYPNHFRLQGNYTIRFFASAT